MVSNLKVDKIQSVAGTTTAIDISSDGTTNFAKTPHWRLVHSVSGVDAPSGSWSQVNLDTALYDTHSLKNGNNIIITSETAGMWWLNAHIRMGNRYFNRLIVKIMVGSTDISQFEGSAGSGGTGAYMSAETNTIYRLNAGDTLGMFVYHDYGSNVGVLGNTQGHESWFAGYRISA
tara:strand:- start:604 stop:1128 length:525 start_codon:yes stop_codon:yes gene_type:complete